MVSHKYSTVIYYNICTQGIAYIHILWYIHPSTFCNGCRYISLAFSSPGKSQERENCVEEDGGRPSS